MSNELQKKAVLVQLRLTTWTGRTMDRAATETLTANAGADMDAARVHKRLVDKRVLSRINGLTDRAREANARFTLPWDDKGTRLLPVAMHEQYKNRMAKIFDDRIKAVDELIEGYQDAITDARAMLGDLFDENDYPSDAEIRAKIGAEYEFLPVPDGSHFVADLADGEAKRIKAEIEAHTQARLASAITDVFKRLHDAVAHIKTQIEPTEDGGAKRLHASMIESLKSLLEAVPALNITGDKALTRMAEEVSVAIAGIDVEMLRPKDKAYSAEVHGQLRADLADFTTKFGGYFGSGATQ